MLALISAKSGTIPAPSAPPSPKVLLLVAAKLGPSRTRGTPDTEEDCTIGTWNDIYPHAYDPLTTLTTFTILTLYPYLSLLALALDYISNISVYSFQLACAWT